MKLLLSIVTQDVGLSRFMHQVISCMDRQYIVHANTLTMLELSTNPSMKGHQIDSLSRCVNPQLVFKENP